MKTLPVLVFAVLALGAGAASAATQVGPSKTPHASSSAPKPKGGSDSERGDGREGGRRGDDGRSGKESGDDRGRTPVSRH